MRLLLTQLRNITNSTVTRYTYRCTLKSSYERTLKYEIVYLFEKSPYQGNCLQRLPQPHVIYDDI